MSTKFTGSIANDIGWGVAVGVAVSTVSGLIWFASEIVNLSF